MPIYEYKCESCSAVLEKLQKISDAPLRECPECGKQTLVRLVSAPSFQLKGSGWYETDFKTGNKKHGTGGDGTGASDTVKTETAGSSTPAADSKSKPAATSAD